ncbi:MAG: hypothetical protein EOP09_12655 [Proteobacteria bacterium]|nr:MAG: hypothetical protein EOP09_12655 [Pseudomonadota bacterium]
MNQSLLNRDGERMMLSFLFVTMLLSVGHSQPSKSVWETEEARLLTGLRNGNHLSIFEKLLSKPKDDWTVIDVCKISTAYRYWATARRANLEQRPLPIWREGDIRSAFGRLTRDHPEEEPLLVQSYLFEQIAIPPPVQEEAKEIWVVETLSNGKTQKVRGFEAPSVSKSHEKTKQALLRKITALRSSDAQTQFVLAFGQKASSQSYDAMKRAYLKAPSRLGLGALWNVRERARQVGSPEFELWNTKFNDLLAKAPPFEKKLISKIYRL